MFHIFSQQGSEKIWILDNRIIIFRGLDYYGKYSTADVDESETITTVVDGFKVISVGESNPIFFDTSGKLITGVFLISQSVRLAKY